MIAGPPPLGSGAQHFCVSWSCSVVSRPLWSLSGKLMRAVKLAGAETGSGGRIRDTHATGTGSIMGIGTAGYCVGNLQLEGYQQVCPRFSWLSKCFAFWLVRPASPWALARDDANCLNHRDLQQSQFGDAGNQAPAMSSSDAF